MTAPHSLSLGDPQYKAVNIAESDRRAWREQLGAVGGVSPLLHFVDAAGTRIELSTTHPGGLAQFITGKTTLLSSLIRDDLALRAAKLAAGAIAEKGLELATARGIDSVHLGIGIAEWRHDDINYVAPLLLRPLAIRRYGTDFEVKLKGAPFLNPELARALKEQFSIELDASAFVALAEQDGSFKPNPVIDRLRGLTAHLEWFNVQPRLVVSSFADVATAMLADAADLEHPVLDALAGNTSAKWAVQESFAPVEPQHPDQRTPETDTLLLDADLEQENVVAQIAAGNSVVVKTLPGTGGTQTIVNVLGCLVAQNKRVLVVSPRRSSLAGIAQRLRDIGLDGFAIAPGTLRRDLIHAIVRNEKAVAPKLGEVDDALVRLRKVLLDYRSAIVRVDPALGVSVIDCVTELSRLALLPSPPATTARLDRESVALMARDRSRAAEAIVQAATLGEFKYGPADSPWYRASFESSDAASEAHQLAKRLHSTSIPALLERADRLIGGTRMRPFESINELGVYLRLLVDIRDTLDRFL
ncbi:MAG: AAA family ATPase, partial [Lacisediminihabitans sp.]